MKTKFLSIATILVMLFTNFQTVEAGFLKGILSAFGVSSDSPAMKIADVCEKVGNAYIARETDDSINKYASDEVNDYKTWADEWNAKEQQKVDDFNNEVDEYKINYCKQYGFYDLWVSEHGDQWFELAGRKWFDERNEWQNNELLPWHLRGNAEEETRYNPVDSDISNVVLNTVNLSSEDVQRGRDWQEANKYGKTNIALDVVADVASVFVEDTAVLRQFKNLIKANVNFLNNKENKDPYAVTKRDIDIQNIIFETFDIAAERKEKLLQEKREIKDELIQKGYDNDVALELAGSILAIQKDKNMTENQKKEWLCQIGYYGQEEEILNVAQVINQSIVVSEPEIQKPEVNQDSIDQVNKKELEEKLRKEAIDKVNAAMIDFYVFDETNLTDSQKEELNSIVEIMKKYEDLNILIVGHTCKIGYKNINIKKGLKRAEGAKIYLIEKGISESRIDIDSKGELAPKSEVNSENRRIEFIVK